jgi:hypothetical protein
MERRRLVSNQIRSYPDSFEQGGLACGHLDLMGATTNDLVERKIAVIKDHCAIMLPSKQLA